MSTRVNLFKICFFLSLRMLTLNNGSSTPGTNYFLKLFYFKGNKCFAYNEKFEDPQNVGSLIRNDLLKKIWFC